MAKGGAIRLSESQVAAHNARLGRTRAPAVGVAPADSVAPAPPHARPTGLQRFQSIGRAPASKLNKTEQAWADELEQQRARREIVWWRAHVFNVRLADNTFYRTDFLVLRADMVLEIHEVKGEYVTDKGQMKIKLCAEVLPVIPVVKMTKLSKKNGGGWKREEF